MIGLDSGSRQGNRTFAEPTMPISLVSFAALLVVLSTGCGSQDAELKTSHFEHDHEVAAHWPSGLSDVSLKLRERLLASETTPRMTKEMEDLVSWTAEVAADTDLSEADWIPLYEASESLMVDLRSMKGSLTGDHRVKVESLCNLIDEAAEIIAQQDNGSKETL